MLALVALASLAAACGSAGANAGPLPGTIERHPAGRSFESGPCASWLSPGVAAAYCATGTEVPAPSGDSSVGQIEFTGVPRSGAEGGIAQAVGTLPEGGRIGIRVDSPTEGTLVAQGICGRTLMSAAFLHLRFWLGDSADLSATMVGDTPVIMLTRNGHKIAPTRETLLDLRWMSSNAPSGCAFRVG
jgi:hypothetical protein